MSKLSIFNELFLPLYTCLDKITKTSIFVTDDKYTFNCYVNKVLEMEVSMFGTEIDKQLFGSII